jgi:hypothetical protein
VLRDEEIHGLARAIMTDPEMRLDFKRLNDFTGVRAVEVSTPVLWDTAEWYRRFDSDERVKGSKIALVAAKDVLYGLSLMYHTLRSESPIEFSVFREMSEAREWLGLPSTDAESGSNWKDLGS